MKNGMNVTLETKASRVGGQHGNDAAVVAVSSSNALFAISAQAPTKEEAAEQQGGQQLGMAAQARAVSAPGAESATTAQSTRVSTAARPATLGRCLPYSRGFRSDGCVGEY